jgi:hypothetical protein
MLVFVEKFTAVDKLLITKTHYLQIYTILL